MKKHISKIGSIVFSTSVVIFSLAAAFSGTIAWFNASKTASVSSGSFQVTAGENIQFDLYYLHHFDVDENTTKKGNYNPDTNLFSGYEVAYANPVFMKVNYDNEGHVTDLVDPTNINHLWPAHRVTYAIVVTSGNLGSFSLGSWSEQTSPEVQTKITEESDPINISLSWATNMFGGAYYVTSTNTVTDDISTGFTSYKNDASAAVDKFPYSQTNIAPQQKPSITIVNSVTGESGENKRVILYFSVEFSNDSSTFYSYQNPYYVKDVNGNSNCYESLRLTSLNFKLI